VLPWKVDFSTIYIKREYLLDRPEKQKKKKRPNIKYTTKVLGYYQIFTHTIFGINFTTKLF